MTERKGIGRRKTDVELEVWIKRIARIKKLLVAAAGAFPAGALMAIAAANAWRDVITAWFRK